MTPLPMTPYDITEVPRIAWWPSPFLVAAALVITALLFLLVLLICKKKSGRGS